ncbi:MAG TPA: hypothetical protein VGR87_10455 [Candidatus Limnocylindria bacterium]|jgi:hypothetical protein|nr:hypothetical protein [Candidatus Limnocylindria bacterium]
MRPGAGASRRGVLGGAVLLAIGAGFLLQAAGRADAGYAMFLFLGLAFGAAWWLGTKQYVYLVPAATLIGFAIGLLIPFWFGLPAQTRFPIFLGALAMGLVAVFVLAPQRWAPLVPAALLGAVALVDVVAPSVLQGVSGLVPFFVPIVLIFVGIYLLVEPRGH